MTRRYAWLSVIVVACSQPASRPVTPATPPVVTPAVSASPPLIVGDGAGYVFRDPERRKKLEAAFPTIEKAIEDEMKQQALPGLAVGIVIDGELAYAKGFGVTSAGGKTAPDADTVYRIGSITKSFTGLALLALRDDGALDLDDPLAKWVPGAAKLIYPTRDARPLTLRQLANHTSGLPRMGTFPSEDEPSEKVVVDSLATLALEAAPGTRWHYSNLGFGLLGIAIGHAAKASFHEVVASRILTPLGMTATTWSQDAVPAGKLAPSNAPGPQGPTPKLARLGAVDGAGGIYSSVRDMAKYVAFQLAAYPPRSDEDTGKLRRATVREAHSTGVPSGFKYEPPAVAMSYGFGWSQFQTCRFDDLVSHNGAIDGFRSEVQFSPSRGVGVVVLTNFGNSNPGAFAERMMTALDKTGALAKRAAQPSPALRDGMQRLLAIYHQWDEAAFAKIMARQIDPREKGELETYNKLHGNCTSFEIASNESPYAGRFDVTCERGSFAMELSVNAKGQVQGFFGTSRGLDAPPAFMRVAQVVLALHNKWDDKLAAKHFGKGPVPLERMKTLAADLHARLGDCKATGAVHVGFDWGLALTCTKQDVDMLITLTPQEQFAGVNVMPRDGAKRCD